MACGREFIAEAWQVRGKVYVDNVKFHGGLVQRRVVGNLPQASLRESKAHTDEKGFVGGSFGFQAIFFRRLQRLGCKIGGFIRECVPMMSQR